MQNNDDTIYCSRCGAEMKASSRYCMKCGNLNYDHPDNINMKKVMGKEQEKADAYQVGSGKFILGDVGGTNNVVQSVANNTGNKSFAFLLPFGVYLLIILGRLGIVLSNGDVSIDTILKSSFPLFACFISISFLYIYSIELLFMKANKKWWAGLIPVYNVMILSEMAFNKKKLGLISLIPYVGIIYLFVLFYKIGEKFKYSGIITALVNVVMIPIIAYGNHPYDGRIFVDDSKNATEKDYSRKRIFLITTILFTIVGLLLYMLANLTQVKDTSTDVGDLYYVYASKKIVNKIEKSIKKENFACSDEVVYDATNGTYYVYSGDAGDEFGLFMQLMREPIEAYVKIENVNGETKYYISMTDGSRGFPETLIDNVDTSVVADYKELVKDYKRGNSCYIDS